MSGGNVEGRIYKIRGWTSHASIIVFGVEFDYSATGINMKIKPSTDDCERYDLGTTNKTEVQFYEFVNEIRRKWSAADYRLLGQNCPYFISEVCAFLGVKNLVEENVEFFNKLPDIPMTGLSSSSNKEGSNKMGKLSSVVLTLGLGIFILAKLLR